jgi:uncharacterized paraquat-inducible protein A
MNALREQLALEAERSERRLRRRAAGGPLLLGVVILIDLSQQPSGIGSYMIPFAAGVYLLSMLVALNQVSARRRALAALDAGLVSEEAQTSLADAAPKCRKCGTALLMETVECPACGTLVNQRRSIVLAIIISLIVLGLFALGFQPAER